MRPVRDRRASSHSATQTRRRVGTTATDRNGEAPPRRDQLLVTRDVLEDLTRLELPARLGYRPLTEVLATASTSVAQSAVEATLASWLNNGTGRRG